MKLKIGNVELKNNIILAPMAGVTTSSFRRICLEHNAGLVCTEMISDKGLQYENQKTLKMVEIKEWIKFFICSQSWFVLVISDDIGNLIKSFFDNVITLLNKLFFILINDLLQILIVKKFIIIFKIRVTTNKESIMIEMFFM